jgi:hypothetical protein
MTIEVDIERLRTAVVVMRRALIPHSRRHQDRLFDVQRPRHTVRPSRPSATPSPLAPSSPSSIHPSTAGRARFQRCDRPGTRLQNGSSTRRVLRTSTSLSTPNYELAAEARFQRVRDAFATSSRTSAIRRAAARHSCSHLGRQSGHGAVVEASDYSRLFLRHH